LYLPGFLFRTSCPKTVTSYYLIIFGGRSIHVCVRIHSDNGSIINQYVYTLSTKLLKSVFENITCKVLHILIRLLHLKIALDVRIIAD